MAVEMQWGAVTRWLPVAAGVVLLAAGGVQFTSWKARQLPAALAPDAAVQIHRTQAGGAGGHVPRMESPLDPDLCCTAQIADQGYDRDLPRPDAGHQATRGYWRYIRVPAAPDRSRDLHGIPAWTNLHGAELDG